MVKYRPTAPPPICRVQPGRANTFILNGTKQQSSGTDAKQYNRQVVPETIPEHSFVPVQTPLAEPPSHRDRSPRRAASCRLPSAEYRLAIFRYGFFYRYGTVKAGTGITGTGTGTCSPLEVSVLLTVSREDVMLRPNK